MHTKVGEQAYNFANSDQIDPSIRKRVISLAKCNNGKCKKKVEGIDGHPMASIDVDFQRDRRWSSLHAQFTHIL